MVLLIVTCVNWWQFIPFMAFTGQFMSLAGKKSSIKSTSNEKKILLCHVRTSNGNGRHIESSDFPFIPWTYITSRACYTLLNSVLHSFFFIFDFMVDIYKYSALLYDLAHAIPDRCKVKKKEGNNLSYRFRIINFSFIGWHTLVYYKRK